MTDRVSEQRTLLESEFFLDGKRRERRGFVIGTLGLGIAAGSVALCLMLLPLKETQAYLTIVDKDTGMASRAVEVAPATMSEAEAVRKGLLFNYVMDRETYDENDNETRLLKVFRMSSLLEQDRLRSLWNPANPTYPPTLYGAAGKVSIKVLSISEVSANTATVRFTKTFSQTGEEDRSGKFYATVSYAFQPSTENAVELVWENPLGFVVTSYRVTAESLEDQE
ncbi:type IV secretion system protein [Paracoccus sp. CPCC 101403]|uniref:Type IV secretion system protein n=1 Tax=Paracoccus broussonetiae TaxID=3075834 RepID=A0ABU3EKB5_9RHOB|nr:type IV secretion system protein [Paracoccus sp. CPCC 101403]MDT1064692.1 type IV secretion system protein [Paracoccus sp. CPCC 101403]